MQWANNCVREQRRRQQIITINHKKKAMEHKKKKNTLNDTRNSNSTTSHFSPQSHMKRIKIMENILRAVFNLNRRWHRMLVDWFFRWIRHSHAFSPIRIKSIQNLEIKSPFHHARPSRFHINERETIRLQNRFLVRIFDFFLFRTHESHCNHCIQYDGIRVELDIAPAQAYVVLRARSSSKYWVFSPT